jgi:predicted kinase
MGLAQDIGAAPGAVHLRSDIERKMLAGVPLNARLPDDAYTPKASEQVYRQLLEKAEPILSAGQSVIIDAVYAAKSERAEVEALARRLGVGFSGYWLEAPEDVMTERVGSRVNDASDATPDVVRTQLGYSLGDIRWERIDASVTPDETLARLKERRPSPPASRA